MTRCVTPSRKKTSKAAKARSLDEEFDTAKAKLQSVFDGGITDEAISLAVEKIDELIRTFTAHRSALIQRQDTVNKRRSSSTDLSQPQEVAKA
jgi:hypothetical protein